MKAPTWRGVGCRVLLDSRVLGGRLDDGPDVERGWLIGLVVPLAAMRGWLNGLVVPLAAMRLVGVFTTMIGSRSWFERSYSLVALTCQSFESRDTSVILSASIASSPMSVLAEVAKILRTTG